MTAYKHKEAFCTMWYWCDTCGAKERLWNSRDGVTPYAIDCRSCGAVMHHDDWSADQCQPKYLLKKGQRYFKDGTVEDAVAIVKRRSRRLGAILKEAAIEMMCEKIRAGTSEEFRKGWPSIGTHGFVEVTEISR